MAKPMEIGPALQRWRQVRGLSLRALGAQAGVDFSTIHRVEAGRLNPTVNLLARLARALGATVPALFLPPPIGTRKRVRKARPRGKA